MTLVFIFILFLSIVSMLISTTFGGFSLQSSSSFPVNTPSPSSMQW